MMTADADIQAALDKLSTYLSWVPPGHAKDARDAEKVIAAEVERLTRDRGALVSSVPAAERAVIAERRAEAAEDRVARLEAAIQAAYSVAPAYMSDNPFARALNDLFALASGSEGGAA